MYFRRCARHPIVGKLSFAAQLSTERHSSARPIVLCNSGRGPLGEGVGGFVGFPPDLFSLCVSRYVYLLVDIVTAVSYNGGMMNQSTPNDWAPPHGIPRPTPHHQLGFDPTDYSSWPYGFSGAHENLQLEGLSLERAPELDFFELLAEVNKYDDDGPSEQRTMEMALRLFLHLVTCRECFNGAFDPRVNGLAHTDIFAAALDTALIWERG